MSSVGKPPRFRAHFIDGKTGSDNHTLFHSKTLPRPRSGTSWGQTPEPIVPQRPDLSQSRETPRTNICQLISNRFIYTRTMQTSLGLLLIANKSHRGDVVTKDTKPRPGHAADALRDGQGRAECL